jgi:hypothetical protein
MEGMYLQAGQNETFTNLDPYLRMPYGRTEKTLWSGTGIPYPYAGTPLTPGAYYQIWAVVVKIPSYPGDVDDNPANNCLNSTSLVCARYPGDFQFNGHIGSTELGKVLVYYGTYASSNPAVYEASIKTTTGYSSVFELDFNDVRSVGSYDLGMVLVYYGTYYGPFY